MGPTQPPIRCVPGLKRQGREADHSPPPSAEVRKGGAIPPLPPYVFMAWCLTNYAQGQLYLFVLPLLLSDYISVLMYQAECVVWLGGVMHTRVVMLSLMVVM
jgi:hypothetical protein